MDGGSTKLMEMELAATILRRLLENGVRLWVDGGWGIDALLRRQSRPHRDLDVAISNADLPRAFDALAKLGFVEINVKPGRPARIVLLDPSRHQVDRYPLLISTTWHCWRLVFSSRYRQA